MFTVGDTEMLAVFALVLHVYELAPLAVNVVEEVAPIQRVVFPLTANGPNAAQFPVTEAVDAIQFDVAPFNANPVNVPVLFDVVRSVKLVTVALLAEATPWLKL